MATLLLLAACPPGNETTTEGTGTTESEGTTGTTGGSNAEASVTEPTTNMTAMTETEGTATSGSVSESESNGSTDGTTEQGPTTTDGPTPECSASEDCRDPALPFCENEVCVNCSGAGDPDTACAGLNGEAPVCSPDGTCVECTAEKASLCAGNTPVCGEGNACAGCTQHDQCGESACNFETGGCFGLEYVLYVDRAAVCDGGAGTMEAPFCKIGDALTKMQEDLAVGWTVKIKGGNYLEEPLVVPDGATAVLTRWGDASPKIRALDDSGPTLTIQNSSKVYVDRLQINSNDSNDGIICANATVWIDDTRIASNREQGYESDGCTTRINRAVIFDNDGGGLASYGAGKTHIVNSYISGNGTQNGGDFGGIRSAQGNELHLIYSTVVNNLSAMGPRSLQCVDAGNAEIRNSILIGFGTPSVDCPTGTFTNSAIDEGAMEGDTNYAAVQMDIMNFFEAPNAGVYMAKAGTAIETLAIWMTGDPTTDFNGTPRANMDGAMDFAGADRP